MDIIITISALALGLAFGIFILVRLRAEPVEDKDDEERRRSIEKSLGLGKPSGDRLILLSIPFNSSARSWYPERMYELRGSSLCEYLAGWIEAL